MVFRLLYCEDCKRSSALFKHGIVCYTFPAGVANAKSTSVYWQCNQFLSSALKVFCAVMDGKTLCLIMSSNGWSRSAMSGMVLAKYAQLLASPCVNAV